MSSSEICSGDLNSDCRYSSSSSSASSSDDPKMGFNIQMYQIKNQGVFVNHYAPGGNKVQKAIFSFKVKVKVTRSLTLVSFERVSLVEYACQI